MLPLTCLKYSLAAKSWRPASIDSIISLLAVERFVFLILFIFGMQYETLFDGDRPTFEYGYLHRFAAATHAELAKQLRQCDISGTIDHQSHRALFVVLADVGERGTEIGTGEARHREEKMVFQAVSCQVVSLLGKTSRFE